MPSTMTCGISTDFSVLSPTKGQVTHVLLTRSPLGTPPPCGGNALARLACVRHAASVNPEPGSNSPYEQEPKALGPESLGLSESFPLFSCQGAGPSSPLVSQRGRVYLARRPGCWPSPSAGGARTRGPVHEAIVQPLRTERKAPPGAPRPSGRSPPVLPQAGRPQTCPLPMPPASSGRVAALRGRDGRSGLGPGSARRRTRDHRPRAARGRAGSPERRAGPEPGRCRPRSPHPRCPHPWPR
jgi:hypothetical protein